jgi:hypothetical protein
MANPDPPYLTQQWSGITHYICPLCGFNTFNLSALDGHWCRPMPADQELLALEPQTEAPASVAAPEPESEAEPEAVLPPEDSEQEDG